MSYSCKTINIRNLFFPLSSLDDIGKKKPQTTKQAVRA